MRGGAELAPAEDAEGRPMPMPPPEPPPEPPDELARARERIAALERKIGQQQVDLDFFKGALRRIEASRRPSDGPGGTGSSPRSRR